MYIYNVPQVKWQPKNPAAQKRMAQLDKMGRITKKPSRSTTSRSTTTAPQVQESLVYFDDEGDLPISFGEVQQAQPIQVRMQAGANTEAMRRIISPPVVQQVKKGSRSATKKSSRSSSRSSSDEAEMPVEGETPLMEIQRKLRNPKLSNFERINLQLIEKKLLERQQALLHEDTLPKKSRSRSKTRLTLNPKPEVIYQQKRGKATRVGEFLKDLKEKLSPKNLKEKLKLSPKKKKSSSKSASKDLGPLQPPTLKDRLLKSKSKKSPPGRLRALWDKYSPKKNYDFAGILPEGPKKKSK